MEISAPKIRKYQKEETNENSLGFYRTKIEKINQLTKEEEKKHGTIIQLNLSKIIQSLKKHRFDIPELIKIKQTIQARLNNKKVKYIDQATFQNIVQGLNEVQEKYTDNPEILTFAYRLSQQAQQIQEAKLIIINANLRFVLFIAKQYNNMATMLNLDKNDLIQAGNEGLMRAALRFNPLKHENQFNSYAGYWIRQSILRYIVKNSRTIRISFEKIEELNEFIKLKTTLEKELNREATQDDLLKQNKLQAEKIDEFLSILTNLRNQSLDEPVGKDNSFKLKIDTVASSTIAPEYEFIKKDIAKKIRTVLSKLSPREEKILRLRFGIGEEKALTYEKIGERFNVSRECIRQTEKKVIKICSFRMQEQDFI